MSCLALAADAPPACIILAYKPGSFLFTLETNGQMPPEQVVISAFEVLDEKIELIRAAADERDAYTLQ